MEREYEVVYSGLEMEVLYKEHYRAHNMRAVLLHVADQLDLKFRDNSIHGISIVPEGQF